MAEPAPRPGMTVGEFLAWDDGTDTRCELVGGAMIAMNPPADAHVRIAMNVYDSLAGQLSRPCRAYMGGGVWRKEDDDTWREPDIFFSCDPERFSRMPRLIVEVLSPSSEKEDRTRKLDFYRRFESVEAILLVWQDTPRVELQERAEGAWIVRDIIGGGDVAIASLGLAIPLSEIYA